MDSMERPALKTGFNRSFWRSAPVADSQLEELTSGNLPSAEFRLLADNIPTLCWIANGDGYIVWYNRRWHEYCGTTAQEMEGWGWQSVHDPELLPAVMERWTRSIATGEPFEMTFPLRGADGIMRPFLTRVQPLRDSSGKTVRWFGVNTEISEQVAAERQLQRNHDTFYSLIKDDPFGIYVVDADFRLAVISRGSEKVFANVQPLIGRDFAEILRIVWTEPFATEAIEHFRHTLETGEPYSSQRTVERRSDIDETESYDWRIQRIVLPDGRYGIVCYFYDLSERQRWEEALREASERIELALNAGAIAGTWVWDIPNDRFSADERFARSFGLDPEQCRQGIPLGVATDSIHPDDLPQVERLIEDALRDGGDYRAEYRVRQRDCEYHWVEAVGRCELDVEGRPLRFPGVLVDIDLRKKDEAALAESEARFREVANAAPVLIWVADTENKGIWYNKAWLDFTGRPMEEELGDGWLERVHPDDLERCAEICGGSFERREPFRLDFRLRRADGEWRVIHDTAVPRFAEDGEFMGYIGTCLDVTEARRSEAALRASEEKHRRIFEQTSDLIFTANLDQVITACNPAAADAIGLPREQAVGRNIADFVSPEDLELTRKMLKRKLEHGGTTRYEIRVHNTDGSWRYWEINSGLTFDDAGVPVGLHVVGRDITERKTLERHQRILVAELNHRVKNTLAIVQSLAYQTFRKGEPSRESVAAFEGRLEALAAAHNLLTGRNWEAASVEDIISSALKPFCGSERCTVAGPEIMLPPETAVGLSLAVHELATNASKYGALSNDTGHVRVGWKSGDGRLELSWQERDGPPVTPPTSVGFGTRLIRRTLAAEFDGEVELDFAPAGLECRVAGPLPTKAD